MTQEDQSPYNLSAILYLFCQFHIAFSFSCIIQSDYTMYI